MPTQNSAADIVSSQWEPPVDQPRLVAFDEVVRSREFELLCGCSGDGGGVSPALGQHLQWDRVLEQASYHRLLPALYAALRDQPEVPASIQSALRARYVRHCQRAMRLAAELVEILQQFETCGVPVIAQKGPALAHLLYGDSAMREFGDLDLLVRPSDVPRAVAALDELGYQKNLLLSPRQEKSYLQSGYEHVFGRGMERNLVELQWNLLPRFYAVDADIDALFARSEERELDGCHARMLRLDDQLLFLCVHAAKHQWAQLGMVRDIAAIARFDLDWKWVLYEARRLGILQIVLISVLLAHELASSELPECVDGLKELAAAQRFVAEIIKRMATMPEIRTESVPYFRFMLQIRERWLDRARFVWRLATTPSVGEWEAAQISDAFFPLYFAIRILRLFRRVAR